MSLSEQIFVNKQFLDDLNSLNEMKLFKATLSAWGYFPDETLDKITSMEYLLNSVLKVSSQEDIQAAIVDTIIEDDLVSLLVPDISLNNYYSIVLFYDKTLDSGEQKINIPALVMYTQPRFDTTVLPLVSFAENRIYVDLRSLPLKAKITNFMSPYNQFSDSGELIEHAPAYHQHVTKVINSTDSSDYNQSSFLTDIDILNRIILSSTSTYCTNPNYNIISRSSTESSIGINGDFLESYIPANIDDKDFYKNFVGCAYEWANSRLCTEDLVDGWPIRSIKDMPSIINVVNYPSANWSFDGMYCFTSWQQEGFQDIENVTLYQNLSLRFVDENQEATTFACTGVEDLTSNKNYSFALPEEGVYNFMNLREGAV